MYVLGDVINSPYINGGLWKGTMWLIRNKNLQVYPLYDSLCPTIYHHHNCPYNVSIYERVSIKNPLEGHYNILFSLKITTTKVCPRSFLPTFYFYLENLYSKKNPSDAIYKTTFFTFHIIKNPSNTYTSGKKW